MELNDQELLTLLATNLYQHFNQVVIRYQHRLYAFARRLTGSAQDAEDIVQEAFVSAYVSLENYAPQRIQTLKLQPWLYRVTLNVYTHHARGSRLHLVPLNITEDSSLLEIADSDDERPEVIVEHLERHQELEALVSQLPERYRVALTCYYFEHLNYQEIAELLASPIGTVKSTISRGTQLLRKQLTTSTKPLAAPGRESDTWNTRKINDSKA